MAGHKTSHSQLERYQIIDRVISSNVAPSFDYLLRILRVELKSPQLSPASVHRDLTYMKQELGAPIIYNRKKNGYIYASPYTLPVTRLNPRDLTVLAILKKSIANFGEESPLYNTVIDVLERTYPQADDKLVTDRIYVAKSPRPVFEKDVYDKVLYAIRENLCLDFVYRSKWEPGKNHRIVKPCQLIMDKGHLYLYAADEKDNSKIRLYSFSRMQEVQVLTGMHFDLPENYRFAEDFEEGRFGAFQYDEAYDFKIEVYGEARNYLHESVWSENQQLEEFPDEQKTVISFTTSQWIPVEHWLLSFGSGAKPLEPDWFVDWWKDEIKKIVENLK